MRLPSGKLFGHFLLQHLITLLPASLPYFSVLGGVADY